MGETTTPSDGTLSWHPRSSGDRDTPRGEMHSDGAARDSDGCPLSASVSDTAEMDPCPSCGTTIGVQPIAGTSPGVQAWSCAACGTDWAISSISPQPYFDRLATALGRLGCARSILQELITLAGESPALTYEQLRDRLLAVADRAVSNAGPFPTATPDALRAQELALLMSETRSRPPFLRNEVNRGGRRPDREPVP